MRPKDIAINIIYKILQPNVKLFCVMTRHFARPVFAVTLSKHRILVVLRATHSMSLRHHILVVIRATHFMSLRAHCPLWGPRGILCTRGEKAHTNKRVSVIACDNAISKVQCAPHRPEGNPFHKTHARYFCTCVEKKAHTSKRVSIIVYNNVISKAQLSGTPRDTFVPVGKRRTQAKE